MSVLSAEQSLRGGRLLIDRDDEISSVATDSTDVAERFDSLVRGGLLDLPLTGMGCTWRRLSALSEIAAADLSLAHLAEGHADALAILAEADVPPPAGRLSVWAADLPDGRVMARRSEAGWTLRGTKKWCRGGELLDAALVTAHTEDGYQLFLVDVNDSNVSVSPGGCNAVGMRDSATSDVTFDNVGLPLSAAIGDAGWYVDRWGFWPGRVGVAACGYGGARGLTARLTERMMPSGNPFGLAALGAATALCDAMEAHLRHAASQLDGGPGGCNVAELAWSVRSSIELLAGEALTHIERGLGAATVTQDRVTSRLMADLPVYLLQHHGGRDLEALGRAAVER